MSMASEPAGNERHDAKIPFYVGHHDSQRTEVSSELLQQARDCNYDMLTVPITTPYFNLRVLNQVISYLSESGATRSKIPIPSVPSLSALDTNLGPSEDAFQLLGVISPWIDLCSPDPVVFNISRQVLDMEVAYAAFCGIGNLILPSPRLHHGKIHGDGVTQYAHAIQEALDIGNFIQLAISMPMMDNPHDSVEETNGSLALQARAEYMGASDDERQRTSEDTNSLKSRPEELLLVKPKSKIHVSSKHDYFGTWDAWNVIRTICKYNSRLFVALMMPRYLPPASVCSRWHSEPLRILTLNPRTYFDNRSGYPVLHAEHKGLISKYMRLRNPPWLLLCDVAPIPGFDNPEAIFQAATGSFSSTERSDSIQAPTPAEANGVGRTHDKTQDPLQHLNILRRLQNEQQARSELDQFSASYQDYLQSPLQPLTDNLESITYEVFEKDPIKYNLYETAIERALMDWRQQRKPASGSQGKVVVAVVGAGRGPLVTRALRASETTKVDIEMWAVEKNPNAFVLLERHNMQTWNNAVQLVRSDMRSWKGPSRPTTTNGHNHPYQTYPAPATQEHYPVDILISELLGSFADNELSPECLDGILPLLNPTYGLSIPHSYTAYLTPIAAPKLHADILSRTPTEKEAPDTPYVVMLHAIDYLSLHPDPTTGAPAPTAPSTGGPTASTVTTFPTPHVQAAWSFTHGPLPKDNPALPRENTHNTRQTRLSFPLKDRAVCHGLAGYFESVLYPGVELSTHPHTMERKSAGMMSWFPIFFPVKNPIYTPDNASLTVSMSRRTDGRKVWYEWTVEPWMEVPGAGGHQRDGREGKKVRLGVSEVGSSKERGCMM